MNIRQEGKIANSLRLVAGNRDGKTKRILVCPLSSPYLTNTNICPAGISVAEEINFTFDIRLSLTG